MTGKMGKVRGTCVECCGVERIVGACREGDRCVRCLCLYMPQGCVALSA